MRFWKYFATYSSPYLAGFSVLLAAQACGGLPAKTESIPTPVQVRTVDRPSAIGAQRYSGSIEPATRVELSFKAGGHVRSIAERVGADGRRHLLQDGDRVKKGEVLVTVKESDYQVRLDAARSSLAEARAAERQARLDHQRSAKLLATKSVSQAETDGLLARLDQAIAHVSGAEAKVREAALALEDCTVKAPIDGVILRRSIEVGTLVAAGQPAFVLADTEEVKVVFGAPDRMVEKLAIGAPMEVEVPATAAKYAGRISRIAPSADRNSRVFDVEVVIPNGEGQLRAGMVASLSIAVSSGTEPSLALPLTSILRSPSDPKGFAVYVVDGVDDHGVAQIRDVQLGEIRGNQVLVAGGLVAGERVVSMGATLLADGGAVRVIPTQEK
jgi:RND family efflux transporter MFP subunit